MRCNLLVQVLVRTRSSTHAHSERLWEATRELYALAGDRPSDDDVIIKFILFVMVMHRWPIGRPRKNSASQSPGTISPAHYQRLRDDAGSVRCFGLYLGTMCFGTALCRFSEPVIMSRKVSLQYTLTLVPAVCCHPGTPSSPGAKRVPQAS